MIKANKADLYRELWLRRRERGLLVWRTKMGTIVPIKDMSDEHLINTLNMLERQEASRAIYEDIWEHEGEIDPLEYYD